MKFFILISPNKPQGSQMTEFIPQEPFSTGDAPRCEACGHAVGMLPWLPPHIAGLELWSNKPGYLAFGPPDEILVSRRFADGYDRMGLLGLDSFNPVKISRTRTHGLRGNIEIPLYYCTLVRHGSAAIDDIQSGLIREFSSNQGSLISHV